MPTETLDVRVRNLDCEHDARALERVIGDSAGVESLRVLPKAGRVTLSFDPSVISGAALREQLAASGFPPRDASGAGGIHGGDPGVHRRVRGLSTVDRFFDPLESRGWSRTFTGC